MKMQKEFHCGDHIMRMYADGEYEVFLKITGSSKTVLLENGYLNEISDLAVEILAEGTLVFDRDEVIHVQDIVTNS